MNEKSKTKRVQRTRKNSGNKGLKLCTYRIISVTTYVIFRKRISDISKVAKNLATSCKISSNILYVVFKIFIN